jgi:hypothetical protein
MGIVLFGPKCRLRFWQGASPSKTAGAQHSLSPVMCR